ncbi:MAG: hypothetical protein ACI4PF_06425 [Christensenellales bacterium]
MKKIKYWIASLILVCSCLVMTGCDFMGLFGPSIKNLQVRYTSNLQLLVGEEWHDELIK